MGSDIASCVEIYGLRDPDTLALRYIGKAKNAAKRLAGHLREVNRAHYPLYCWIAKLRLDGKLPVLDVLDRVADSEWQKRERELIAISRARGERLLNVADGGDQPACTQEQRSANGRQMNAALRASPKAMRIRRLKIGLVQHLRGGKASDELKATLRRGLTKHPQVFGCFEKYL